MVTRLVMTEDDLLATVLDLCKVHRCLVHHDRPARTKDGWRTAISGDSGFPDVVIAGAGGFLFRELKNATATVPPHQLRWLRRVGLAGGNVGVWRPADLHSGLILAEIESAAAGGS